MNTEDKICRAISSIDALRTAFTPQQLSAGGRNGGKTIREDLRIARAALQFRKPEKLLPGDGRIGRCPLCGYLVFPSMHYCGNCGQAIKRKEEDNDI